MKSFKDHEYVRTKDDLFFCIVGYLHPTDKIISFLKYVPDEKGKWGRREERYRRALPDYSMSSLLDTFQFLEEEYPEYLYDFPELKIEMSAVPFSNVEQHYRPQEKIGHLFKVDELDPLQQDVVELVSFLSDESGIPIKYFGVTGSTLIGIHRPEFSNIDLTIHGLKNSQKLKKIILSLYETDEQIRRLEDEEIKEWCQKTANSYSINFEEAKKISKRMWNKGLFKGRFFEVHPIKLGIEITEEYGDREFFPEDMVEVRATVSDSTDAMFVPSTYGLKDVEVLAGPKVRDITEVTTYHGLYSDIAKRGEDIRIKGKLEKVLDKKRNEEYYRILIGSRKAAGKDFIKPEF